ncbi:MAG: MoxR family ATPase [Phycisphaerae bacterium]|nr:MoxR family ATPase [Phycisphaerae bacterium]
MQESLCTPEEWKEGQAAIDAFKETFVTLRDQVRTQFIGQGVLVDDLLSALFAGGHVLLEGVPGLGKTMLVRTLSQAVQLGYERIQCTPDLMPADIVGCMTLIETDHGGHQLTYQQGPVVSNFVLVDEINRATPRTQSALLEAMQEGQVTVGTRTVPLPQPNIFIATQNPVEQEGTYPLPEAQIDRFMVKLLVRYPDPADYHAIIDNTTGVTSPAIQAVISGEKILTMRRWVRQVEISRPVLDYAVRLVVATQPEHTSLDLVKEAVSLGVSPRGVQSLVVMGKVKALLDGRTSVSCKDLQSVALATLRHRVLLSYRAAAQRITQDQVVEAVLQSTPTTGHSA